MAKISVRYFTVRRRKDGGERFFWQPNKALAQAGWKLTRLAANRNEALSQAEAINGQVDEWRAGVRKDPSTHIAGSVDALIESYKKSGKYKKLAKGTLRDYDRHLKMISEWAGDMPAGVITSKMAQDLYAQLKLKSTRTADYAIQVLRILFNHGERESIIPKGSNPASKPGLDYKAPKGKLWSPEAIGAFAAAADALGHFEIGTAILINEWIGQRKGDIISLKMDVYKNGELFFKQSKTDAEAPIYIKLIPLVIARLDAQMRRNADAAASSAFMIQDAAGEGYDDYKFDKNFTAIRDKVSAENPEFKNLIFKDLRHTAVTRLGEAGCTPQEIAAITGHSLVTINVILDRYNIRTKKMARNAFTKRVKAEGNDA